VYNQIIEYYNIRSYYININLYIMTVLSGMIIHVQLQCQNIICTIKDNIFFNKSIIVAVLYYAVAM
jgi:hypothetical protein